MVRTSRQPHRRGLKQDDRLSDRAESLLGRLNLNGLISNAQYIAGDQYGMIIGQYRSIIGAPRGTAGAGRGSDCAIGTGFECPDDECACARTTARYNNAFAALMKAGQRSAKYVARALHGQDITPEEFVYLKAGLEALAVHFGLTNQRNRPHSGNAH
jgi:hypothetical protein